MDTEKFFRKIAPRLEDFGRYALAIQKEVYSCDKKISDNEDTNALTDADLMIQDGLARVFLEQGYEFVLDGEEESPYLSCFPNTGNTRVVLDSINGTARYKAGSPVFSDIVSV